MDLVKGVLVIVTLITLAVTGCVMYIDHSGDGEVVVEFFDGNEVPVTVEPIKKGVL